MKIPVNPFLNKKDDVVVDIANLLSGAHEKTRGKALEKLKDKINSGGGSGDDTYNYLKSNKFSVSGIQKTTDDTGETVSLDIGRWEATKEYKKGDLFYASNIGWCYANDTYISDSSIEQDIQNGNAVKIDEHSALGIMNISLPSRQYFPIYEAFTMDASYFGSSVISELLEKGTEGDVFAINNTNYSGKDYCIYQIGEINYVTSEVYVYVIFCSATTNFRTSDELAIPSLGTNIVSGTIGLYNNSYAVGNLAFLKLSLGVAPGAGNYPGTNAWSDPIITLQPELRPKEQQLCMVSKIRTGGAGASLVGAIGVDGTVRVFNDGQLTGSQWGGSQFIVDTTYTLN